MIDWVFSSLLVVLPVPDSEPWVNQVEDAVDDRQGSDGHAHLVVGVQSLVFRDKVDANGAQGDVEAEAENGEKNVLEGENNVKILGLVWFGLWVYLVPRPSLSN